MAAETVVFLDIDGVICTRRAAGWPRARGPNMLLRGSSARLAPPRLFDRSAVAMLDRICEATGALIVVSSSWRLDRDVPAILRKVGLQAAIHPHWRTDADGSTRGDEVARWLAGHGRPRFVILDDTPEFHEEQRPFFIRIDNYAGLSEIDAAAAIDILTSPSADPAAAY